MGRVLCLKTSPRLTRARRFSMTRTGTKKPAWGQTSARGFLAAPLAAQKVPRLDSYDGVVIRILQSNNAGDVQHIIDPLTNEVVGVIEGCPRPHNLFAHPDGLYYYCTNETESTLDVFDTRSLELVTQLPLTARPNKGAINKKHRNICPFNSSFGHNYTHRLNLAALCDPTWSPNAGGIHDTKMTATPDQQFIYSVTSRTRAIADHNPLLT